MFFGTRPTDAALANLLAPPPEKGHLEVHLKSIVSLERPATRTREGEAARALFTQSGKPRNRGLMRAITHRKTIQERSGNKGALSQVYSRSGPRPQGNAFG